MENPQRKPAGSSPWTGSAHRAMNGNSGPLARPSSAAATDPAAEIVANSRLKFLMANFIGLNCMITLKSGERFSGIFSSASLQSPEPRYLLKMVRKLSTGPDANASEYVNTSDNHAVTFNVYDVTDLSVDNVTSGGKSHNDTVTFKTDTDISGARAGKERDLERWNPSAGLDGKEIELEDNHIRLDSSTSGWDQFAANANLYGVKSDYNESFYTTAIDTSHPEYNSRRAMAEKIAQEIEKSSAITAHVAEERGQIVDDGTNEEDKYSGVARTLTGNPNAYVPPALRDRERNQPKGQAHPQPTKAAAQKPQVDSATIPAHPPKATVPSSVSDQQLASVATESPQTSQKSPMPDKSAATQPPKAQPKLNPSISDLPASGEQPVAKPGLPARAAALPNFASGKPLDPLLEAFSRFSKIEKDRVKDALPDEKRSRMIQDLKEWGQNFKLPAKLDDKTKSPAKTPVADASKAAPPAGNMKATAPATISALPTAADLSKQNAPEAQQPPTAPTARGKQDNSQQQATPHDRNQQRTRNFATPTGNNGRQVGPTPGNGQRQNNPTFGQRLQDNRFNRGPVTNPGFVPQATPIQDHRTPSVPTPSSQTSSRLNVQAMEFRPGAASFTPSSKPSPAPAARAVATPKAPTQFFGSAGRNSKKEKKSLRDHFNPIIRMTREVAESGKQADYGRNYGIPQAYRTSPTWDVSEANQEKSYVDMFEKVPVRGPGGFRSNAPPPVGTGHMPQTQHIPVAPVHTPRHTPLQPHHMPAGAPFEDHRMHYPGHPGMMQPSPRVSQPMMYGNGVPYLPYGPMVPLVNMRSYPAGLQFGANGGMGGHVMSNQSSNGGYSAIMNPHMYPPGMAMYQGMAAPQGPNSFPSPTPRAAPIMPQGGGQPGGQGHQHGHQQMYNSNQGGPMFQGQGGGPNRGNYSQNHQFPHMQAGGPHFQPPNQAHHFQQTSPHRAGQMGSTAHSQASSQSNIAIQRAPSQAPKAEKVEEK